MKKKQANREPTLYIVGNPENKDEIRHIIEDVWGGYNAHAFRYINDGSAYCINASGVIVQVSLFDDWFKEAVEKGLIKEYKLHEYRQFEPFDKVVTRPKNDKSLWTANYYSHNDKEYTVFVGGSMVVTKNHIILTYNEQTKKLIGTRDEWKGGDE